jgi:hypothetical protein
VELSFPEVSDYCVTCSYVSGVCNHLREACIIYATFIFCHVYMLSCSIRMSLLKYTHASHAYSESLDIVNGPVDQK